MDITPEDLAKCYSHMGHLEKVNMGTYKCPLALMAITQVGKYLMVLDVCTGKEGKAGLCYENTLIGEKKFSTQQLEIFLIRNYYLQ